MIANTLSRPTKSSGHCAGSCAPAPAVAKAKASANDKANRRSFSVPPTVTRLRCLIGTSVRFIKVCHPISDFKSIGSSTDAISTEKSDIRLDVQEYRQSVFAGFAGRHDDLAAEFFELEIDRSFSVRNAFEHKI